MLREKQIQSKEQTQEAVQEYFKVSIPAENIVPEMGQISVSVKNKAETGKEIGGTTWGAVYWQYFEDLDKIASHETPLRIKKQFYKITLTDKGEVLTPIGEDKPLQVGDKVKVRIELRVDRAMEYVHMKDMRGACFEPINVLSHYKYQGGLGYYEATKDASTNFFFYWLNKGTYVLNTPCLLPIRAISLMAFVPLQCMPRI
ncbi:MAG: hypothetical protein IPJ31_15310 [Bacteroidetes bacterium]|nr:hypothetical protein [Bacteroidota bacterium]